MHARFSRKTCGSLLLSKKHRQRSDTRPGTRAPSRCGPRGALFASLPRARRKLQHDGGERTCTTAARATTRSLSPTSTQKLDPTTPVFSSRSARKGEISPGIRPAEAEILCEPARHGQAERDGAAQLKSQAVSWRPLDLHGLRSPATRKEREAESKERHLGQAEQRKQKRRKQKAATRATSQASTCARPSQPRPRRALLSAPRVRKRTRGAAQRGPAGPRGKAGKWRAKKTGPVATCRRQCAEPDLQV